MSLKCPACGSIVEQKPSLFSLNNFCCTNCESSLRTNIKSRLLFVLSFGMLAAFHLYIKENGYDSEQFIVWGGLASIMVPILITLKTNRYELGEQRSIYSMVVNGTFYIVITLLIGLWAYS